MLSQFELLKSSFYSRVQCTPFEPRPNQVVLSDIVLHLPVLEYYASKCKAVAEFGVRDGCSTIALIAGGPDEVHSYDIERTSIVDILSVIDMPERLIANYPTEWFFHLGDTGNPNLEVPEIDMLFIDTLHTYEHVKKELTYHGRKAKKYLAFHDVYTCGELDRSGPNPNARGIMPAIREFVESYPGEYKEVYYTKANNGFLVLERTNGSNGVMGI